LQNQFEEEFDDNFAEVERLKTIEELNEESMAIMDEFSLRKDKSYNFEDLLKEFKK
jgi:hypothetical protein